MTDWTLVIIIGVMGWGFFLFMLWINTDFVNDVPLLIEQVNCETLKEMDIYLKSQNALSYIKEECF